MENFEEADDIARFYESPLLFGTALNPNMAAMNFRIVSVFEDGENYFFDFSKLDTRESLADKLVVFAERIRNCRV